MKTFEVKPKTFIILLENLWNISFHDTQNFKKKELFFDIFAGTHTFIEYILIKSTDREFDTIISEKNLKLFKSFFENILLYTNVQ